MPIFNFDKDPITYKRTQKKLLQFDNILKNTSTPVFIAITADWCGYCRQMKGAWKTATNDISNKLGVTVINISSDFLQEMRNNSNTLPETIQSILRNQILYNGFPTLVYARSTPKRNLIKVEDLDVESQTNDGFKYSMLKTLRKHIDKKNDFLTYSKLQKI